MESGFTRDEARKWDGLLESALRRMDEVEREAFDRRMAKKASGKSDPVSPDARIGAIKFLLDYSSLDRRFMDCVARSGRTKLEIVTALGDDPELKAVYGMVCDARRRAMEMENEDFLDKARGSFDRLIGEEGSNANVKAVTFAMEKLDRKNFGVAKDGAASGGAQVTYNCPGLTVNMITSPAELESRMSGGIGFMDADFRIVKPDDKVAGGLYGGVAGGGRCGGKRLLERIVGCVGSGDDAGDEDGIGGSESVNGVMI